MGRTKIVEKAKCSIVTCTGESYSLGYCRNHYNSLSRHGDPLQAELNVQIRNLKAEAKRQARANKPKRESNVRKLCKADDCSAPARIKGYCLKHDARLKRNGTLELTKKRSNIQTDECIVMGCTAKPKTHGLCANHYANVKELKTPLRPKIIKQCGVKGCEKKHMANGMCSSHYTQWKAVVRDYKLSEFVELKGWEDDGVWKR